MCDFTGGLCLLGDQVTDNVVWLESFVELEVLLGSDVQRVVQQIVETLFALGLELLEDGWVLLDLP